MDNLSRGPMLLREGREDHVNLTEEARKEKLHVDAFITAIHSQVGKCAYGALKEEMILDRIVVGMRDAMLSLELQRFNDETSCVRCGKTPGHERQHCPAKEATMSQVRKTIKPQCKTKHIRESEEGAAQSQQNKQWIITLYTSMDSHPSSRLTQKQSQNEYTRKLAPHKCRQYIRHSEVQTSTLYSCHMGQFMGKLKRNDTEKSKISML